MKKLLLTFVLLLSVYATAQSQYETAMETNIAKLQKAQNPDDLTALSNTFLRIGKKEKTQWLPYYYASLAQISKGRILISKNKVNELDAVADEAQNALNKAKELSKDNAENYILEKLIHRIRMRVNPMVRYQTESALGQKALEKAKKLAPENPRVTLLLAEDLYFTPEQYGGDKAKAMELFKKALEQFKTYKTKSSLAPNWGKQEAEYFLKPKH